MEPHARESEFPKYQIDTYFMRFDGSTRFSHYVAWYADRQGRNFHCRGKNKPEALAVLRKTLRENGIPLSSIPSLRPGKTYYV